MPAIAEAKGQSLPATQWLGWAIAASLWGHYASSSDARAQSDAVSASKGDMLGLFDAVKASARRVDSLIPDVDELTANVPSAAGVALASMIWLMRTRAASFPSGKLLVGRTEPVELHGLFPRAALDDLGWRDSTTSHDRLGNLALLLRSDIEAVEGKLPREVFGAQDPEVLTQHGIPREPRLWEVPRYAEFCLAREKAQAGMIIDLMRSYGL